MGRGGKRVGRGAADRFQASRSAGVSVQTGNVLALGDVETGGAMGVVLKPAAAAAPGAAPRSRSWRVRLARTRARSRLSTRPSRGKSKRLLSGRPRLKRLLRGPTRAMAVTAAAGAPSPGLPRRVPK